MLVPVIDWKELLQKKGVKVGVICGAIVVGLSGITLGRYFLWPEPGPKPPPPVAEDPLLGLWMTEGGKSRVEITESGGVYSGKIVWLNSPFQDPKDAEPGKPKVDIHNPDPSKRGQGIVGLQLLKDFRRADDNLWKGGTVYDSESGKTYQGKITLKDARTLALRGFVGISSLGRTTVWTRYVESDLQVLQPAPIPAGGAPILGVWLTEGGKSLVDITESGGVYSGRILWLDEPLQGPKDAEPGKPKRDLNNPAPAQRNQPLVGLRMLRDFRRVADNKWERGRVYDPEKGKEYKCTLTLRDPNALVVHGYVVISLLGRTTVWTRYKGEPATATK
jgi:uncharacterized protein (DUF2147 family)